MKKMCLLYACLFVSALAISQETKTGLAIIPEPVSVTKNTGSFTLPQNIVIAAPAGDDVMYVTNFLKQHIATPTGYRVTVNNSINAGTINLQLNKIANTTIGDEGYQLLVTPKAIAIKANKPAGLFYGVQTLLQLFPKEIMSAEKVSNLKWQSPCVTITDYPRFKWRGLMFDVARHFFTKQDVEAYIDQMVLYKLNLLHLHLTDDEGWRIEIKSLPKLTEVGAWNVKKVGQFGSFTSPKPDEPRNYGGFYTQEDIKEIIQYAKERFMNIMPEVDVPGHSLAAVASYPELSCTPGADKYKVNSGEPFMDWTDSGNVALVDNTLCPANEKVYDFLDKVFTEIAALFPFEYIHVGGDECAKNFWKQSDAIKALMQQEGLKDMDEVQSYFEKRVEKIVESKGKKLIGWDEILQGGLAPDAAVMSWRGVKGGIAAAKMNHEVVMSPTTFAYLDYMQSDPVMEPHVYATLRLNKTYSFDPLPDGVDPKYILGGQANLWTEQVYNMRHAEYMTWPRAFAIAEDVWTPKEGKDWNDFAARVEQHFKRFDVAEIKYCPAMYDPIFKASKDANGNLKIEMSTEINGLDIYYSFDNSFPDRFYDKYTAPLTPPTDAKTLKVITYRGKQPIGRMITMPISEMQKRADRKNNDDDE